MRVPKENNNRYSCKNEKKFTYMSACVCIKTDKQNHNI